MPSEMTTQEHNHVVLYRWGAIASFAMPLCYVVMFLVFFVFLNVPQTHVIEEKVAYLAEQQALISLANSVGYLLFGVLLLIALQATHARIRTAPSHLLNTASLFGLIWVVLMMVSGMFALVGADSMAALHAKGSPHAVTVFYLYTTSVNALGGGIELVGGLWMMLLSLAAFRNRQWPRPFHALGLLVGLIGVLTVYQGMPELKEAFGLGQVAWFIWLGLLLLGSSKRRQGGALS